MNVRPDTLSLDLYGLTMAQGYLAGAMEQPAVFEFFVREPTPQRNFLVAAGVEQVLDDLEHFRFEPAELEQLSRQPHLGSDLLDWLEDVRFTGEVHAMAEGTICFANEPFLRVTAPLAEAQLIESRVINRLHFQTLIASKAIRFVLAAPDRTLVDYGLRRAHGLEAGLFAARAGYLAGFAGTSNVLAATQFGIPLYGTMAHSFVEACDSEAEAFTRFALANPGNSVFILDTYDTETAAHRVVDLAPTLRQQGVDIRGVRIDSGDLAGQAGRVRKILDEGGLRHVRILASGNLDEFKLQALVAGGAPIDGFGIGTDLVTSSDAPHLNCAYKLQAYAGRPRRKSSEGKATWPGAKQVYREIDTQGRLARDIVTLATEPAASELPLLQPRMSGGKRLQPAPSLDQIRTSIREQVKQLPPALCSLQENDTHPVVISDALTRLADAMDAGQAAGPVPAAAPAAGVRPIQIVAPEPQRLDLRGTRP